MLILPRSRDQNPARMRRDGTLEQHKAGLIQTSAKNPAWQAVLALMGNLIAQRRDVRKASQSVPALQCSVAESGNRASNQIKPGKQEKYYILLLNIMYLT